MNRGVISARLTKVEFPKKFGEDLKGWLYKCEQFFQLSNVNDVAKVKLAALQLEVRALQWHQSYVRRKGGTLPTWEEYEKALIARFGELYDDPMAELKSLKHAGAVQEYHDAFDAIISRLTLPEDYILSCFLSGLEEEI